MRQPDTQQHSFFKAVNPAPEEKPIDTWAFTFTQKDDWGEMKDDFHNKWGIMDHFRSFGLRHARLVFMYRDRTPEATIGIHKTGRRLRIERQEQWEVAKMRMNMDLAEMVIYIYGMDDADSSPATSSATSSTTSSGSKRKRN